MATQWQLSKMVYCPKNRTCLFGFSLSFLTVMFCAPCYRWGWVQPEPMCNMASASTQPAPISVAVPLAFRAHQPGQNAEVREACVPPCWRKNYLSCVSKQLVAGWPVQTGSQLDVVYLFDQFRPAVSLKWFDKLPTLRWLDHQLIPS